MFILFRSLLTYEIELYIVIIIHEGNRRCSNAALSFTRCLSFPEDSRDPVTSHSAEIAPASSGEGVSLHTTELVAREVDVNDSAV